MASNVYAPAFIPEIWDAKIYRTLEKDLVAKKICKNYSGDIKAFGDTVYFNGLSDPTVADYSGTVSYENLISSSIPLLIDQQKYYGFDVSDLDAVFGNANLQDDQAARAGYALKDACDSYILGSTTYGDALGGTVTNASTTTATILSSISQASRLLDENNVKPNDKWMVIAPWVKEKLVLAGVKFQINEGMDGKKGGMAFCDYLDLTIYVSNNLTNLGTSAVPETICLAGSSNAIVFAEKLMKSEVIRSETAFTNHCRGLYVFGKKVIKPKELIKIDLTYAAETVI